MTLVGAADEEAADEAPPVTLVGAADDVEALGAAADEADDDKAHATCPSGHITSTLRIEIHTTHHIHVELHNKSCDVSNNRKLG